MTTPSKALEFSDHEDDGENRNDNNNNERESNNNIVKPGVPKPDIPVPRKRAELTIGSLISGAFGLSCVFYTLYTTILLVYFLSGNANGILNQKHAWTGLSLLELIIQDIWLLLLFVTQHTIMARDYFKSWISSILPQHLQRCLYVLSTGIAIQVLTSLWVNVLPDESLFVWDYSSSDPCRLLCQILHVFAWVYTFTVIFMLDFSEFIGLKQVYYHVNSFGCPIQAKTFEAQRFFKHFRHATASGFLAVFWVVPCMTLDRLLLASVLTVYLFSTKIDHEDEAYVRTMYNKKIQALHVRSN